MGPRGCSSGRWRSLVPATLTALAVVALAGCGGDSGGTPSVAPPAPEGTLQVLANDNLRYDRDAYTVSAGDVDFLLRNQGALPHTLLIEDSTALDLEVRARGQTDEGTATLEPGIYEIYCDVPGHQATMRATLTVE